MIPSMDATKAINFHRKEALVVATSSAKTWSTSSSTTPTNPPPTV